MTIENVFKTQQHADIDNIEDILSDIGYEEITHEKIKEILLKLEQQGKIKREIDNQDFWKILWRSNFPNVQNKTETVIIDL